MSEVVYEETATMIAAGELQSFVPFGREHCRNHPNAFNLQLRELQPASELWSSDGAAGLVGSLQEVSLQERERVRLYIRRLIASFNTVVDIITAVDSTEKFVGEVISHQFFTHESTTSRYNLVQSVFLVYSAYCTAVSTCFDLQECWQLRKGFMGVKEEDVEFEEELYTAGTVVVWSQGSRTQASNVYKAFTVDSPVQQVGY